MIQDSSRWRSAKAVWGTTVKGGADALLNHNEDQLGLIVGESLKAFDQLWDFILLHHHQLPVWHTITVEHNLLWQVVIHLCKRADVLFQLIICIVLESNMVWENMGYHRQNVMLCIFLQLLRSICAVRPVNKLWSHWPVPHWVSEKWPWRTSGLVSWKK